MFMFMCTQRVTQGHSFPQTHTVTDNCIVQFKSHTMHARINITKLSYLEVVFNLHLEISRLTLQNEVVTVLSLCIYPNMHGSMSIDHRISKHRRSVHHQQDAWYKFNQRETRSWCVDSVPISDNTFSYIAVTFAHWSHLCHPLSGHSIYLAYDIYFNVQMHILFPSRCNYSSSLVSCPFLFIRWRLVLPTSG